MIVQCPDCKRNNNTEVTNGKHKCKKCLQYIVIKDSKPLYCIPKELV